MYEFAFVTTITKLRQLRKCIGKRQKEMADWAGCSPGLIQSIETGRRRLSTEIALRISNSTGVDATWLMSNDSDVPMINSAGEPYDYHRDFKPRESQGC
jgi:transcriptional regulator with XRE-family HTH domain